jgi:hypothetical protein
MVFDVELILSESVYTYMVIWYALKEFLSIYIIEIEMEWNSEEKKTICGYRSWNIWL